MLVSHSANEFEAILPNLRVVLSHQAHAAGELIGHAKTLRRGSIIGRIACTMRQMSAFPIGHHRRVPNAVAPAIRGAVLSFLRGDTSAVEFTYAFRAAVSEVAETRPLEGVEVDLLDALETWESAGWHERTDLIERLRATARAAAADRQNDPGDGAVIYASPRRFEVWDFGVGHRGLLLRSNPTNEVPGRIEVWFKPAYAVCLPSWLVDGIRIERSSRSVDLSSDVGAVLGRSAKSEELLFAIHSGKSVGWVLAGGVHGRADERASHEPRMFGGTGPKSGVRDLFSIKAG